MTNIIPLPKPRHEGPMSLEEALLRRRSVRRFSPQELELGEVGQLLWATQGLLGAGGRRTAPSAGALFPLELYAVMAKGVYYYDPPSHALRLHCEGDLRRALCEASLDQRFILQAPLTVVMAAVYARIEVRYGPSRGPRYVHMEIGHASQNTLLQAVALGLGAVPVGAFDDQDVHAVLALPADHVPLYMIPVGYPA